MSRKYYYSWKECLIDIQKIARQVSLSDFKPDVIISSNVFWIDYLKKLKNKYQLNLIYDCNDNPLAFPNSNNKKIYFDRTLVYSDLIITPFKSYNDFIPKKYQNKIQIISNGVDSNLIYAKSDKNKWVKGDTDAPATNKHHRNRGTKRQPTQK